jgi:hypothetical protein
LVFLTTTSKQAQGLRDSDHCKAAAYQPDHDCLVSQSDIDLRNVQNEQAPCLKDEHYEADDGNHADDNSSAHGLGFLCLCNRDPIGEVSGSKSPATKGAMRPRGLADAARSVFLAVMHDALVVGARTRTRDGAPLHWDMDPRRA